MIGKSRLKVAQQHRCEIIPSVFSVDPDVATGIGDVIVATVRTQSWRQRKKDDVVKAVIVRTRGTSPRRRFYIKFDENAAVLLKADTEPRGTRIFGPSVVNRDRKFAKIVRLRRCCNRAQRSEGYQTESSPAPRPNAVETAASRVQKVFPGQPRARRGHQPRHQAHPGRPDREQRLHRQHGSSGSHPFNVAVSTQSKKPTRVGFREETVEKNGVSKTVRVRYAKASGKDL